MRQGSFRIFRIAGIDVYLNWLWFIFAIYEIQARTTEYSSPIWNVLEYLSLFVIVTMHEFGHALACRSVGGTANQIVLWPLGGVAYVNPPQGRSSTWLFSQSYSQSTPWAARPAGPRRCPTSRNLWAPSYSSTSFCSPSTCCQSTRWMAARSFAPCSGSSWDALAA